MFSKKKIIVLPLTQQIDTKNVLKKSINLKREKIIKNDTKSG